MGKLSVVPTPIGNLEDMTLRGIRILKEADVIACEDTRTGGILMKHYEITTPLISYHQHNEKSRSEELVRRIREGAHVALTSDAGMPGISDPGGVLIRRCREEGLPVEVLPGASAGVTAVTGSAFGEGRFYFYGFLPQKEGARKRELEQLKDFPDVIVFYESPHRIDRTLQSIYEVFGDRNVVLARELTKIHEEYVYGTLEEFLSGERDFTRKGEFVLLTEGAEVQSADVDIQKELEKKIAEGLKKSRAVKEVAKEFSLPKNLVYEESLKL